MGMNRIPLLEVSESIQGIDDILSSIDKNTELSKFKNIFRFMGI
jgi:hypothetical protein